MVLVLAGAPVSLALQTSEKVNQQGGAMSASATKSKVKKMSNAERDNPFATKTDHFIESPPHYMSMWPYDAKSMGFSTTPKKTGMWIM